MQGGDRIPHFVVQTIDGRDVRYADLWQRRLLLLLVLPPAAGGDQQAYIDELMARASHLSTTDAEIVATRDAVPGLPSPSAVVADRWGEVLMVASGGRFADLPSPAELIDWLRYAEHQCPECEGEAR